MGGTVGVSRYCETAALAFGNAHEMTRQIQAFGTGIDFEDHPACGGAISDSFEIVGIGIALQ